MKLGLRNLIINIVPLILFYIEISSLKLPKYSLILLMINLILIIINSILLNKFNGYFTLVKEQIVIDIVGILINFFLISGIYIYLHGNGTIISYSNSLIYLIINFLNIFNYLLRVSDHNTIFNINKKESLFLILINVLSSFIIIYISFFNNLLNTTKLYLKEIIAVLLVTYIFVCWYDIIKIVRRKKYGKGKEKKAKEI